MGVISQTNPRCRLRPRLLCWPVVVFPVVQSINRTKGRLRGAQRNRVCVSLPLADPSGLTGERAIALCESLYGRRLTRE
jgi:hypothetical protein